MSRVERLRFVDFDFDPATGDLLTQAGAARLARQPALILAALARRPGEVVTRADLRKVVWNSATHVDYEQSLNFCIREIRRALGESAREPRFIETLPKRGYRWIAQIESPATRRVRRSWPLAVALATALAAGAVLGHEISTSPLHERAVDWTHRVFRVAPGSCLLG